MNNILIATDYSDNAEKALQYAILLGKAYQAKIYIIHTYLPRFVEPGIYANAEIMQQSLNEQHDAYQAKLVPLANQVEEAGLACEAILELNDVVSGVFDAIEKYDIDLLVMGRTGSGGFLNKLIGSNAAHITAKSKIPVLAIPHQIEKIAIEKILYATQLEFDENHILSQVFDIAHKLKAQVNLTKVNASFEPDIQSDKQFIDQINTAFVKEDFVIDTITADSVTEGIFQATATHQSDLIVLAAHHRNFLSQLIDPSKSKQVIISSHLPVLTFQL